jgi:hypothetical protein
MKKYSYFFLFSILFAGMAYGQKQPPLKTTALNRITLNRNDTVFQFFIKEAPGKFKTFPSLHYYWFSPDTILITQGSFSGKLLDGTYDVFYPNKNLKEKGWFKNGLKAGLWRNWDSGGKLLHATNWDKGKKNGPFEEYDISGVIIRSGLYKDGLLSGEIVEYQNGEPKSKKNYKEGKVVETVSKEKQN